MRFFELRHPIYADDGEWQRRNPVEERSPGHLPSAICEECGTWASSDRLRDLDPARAGLDTTIRFLPFEQWKRRAVKWASALGTSVDRLTPGADVGMPFGVVKGRIAEDAVHPFPGMIWIGPRLFDAFGSAGFSGMSLLTVSLSGSPGAVLWEMFVHGHAWRVGNTRDSIRACEICGRTDFPQRHCFEIDVDRWDKSDVFNVDLNPNIVVVTERVAELVDRLQPTNLVCVPAGAGPRMN